NYHGSDAFTFKVSDGTLSSASDATVAITVTSVNDAPAGTNNTVTVPEDPVHALTTAEFGFTDPLDSPANSLDAVKITTVPGSGSLTNNNVAVTAGQVVTAADITAGHLKFEPAAFPYTTLFRSNYHGSDAFTFKVSDGTLSSASDATVAITVTSVNDAPA